MGILAVLGNHLIRDPVSAETATSRLERVAKVPGAAADSSFPAQLIGDYGSGIAFEELAAFRRRSMDREAAKVADYSREHATVVAHSRLKRTMADQNVLSAMGFGQDNSDPNAPPPTDAHLIMGYFGKVMAKQRWGKAHNAIKGLAALKKGGSLGALAAATMDAEANNSRPRGRVSITTLTAPPAASAMATKKMSDVPADADLAEMVLKLKGNFAFALIEQSKNFIVAARSEGGSVPLYWALNNEDGAIMFGTAPECFPEGAIAQEFPAGYFFCGRCGEVTTPKAYKPLEGDVEALSPGEPLKHSTNMASFCRSGAGAAADGAAVAAN